MKMKPSPGHGGGGGPQRLVPSVVRLAVLGVLVSTVGAIPTSVLASAKDSNRANHDDGDGNSELDLIHQQSVTATPPDARNQISVPQKRGVNPLLYNDLQYAGNSISHGGQWDDNGFDLGPLSAAALYPSLGTPHSDGAARMRNYDMLASLLGPPPQPAQTFYDGPVTPSVSFPYGYYGLPGTDRAKRMANFGHAKNQRQRSLSSRPKRSPGKLSAADALSLLAILDARDPYPATLSDYFPYLPPPASVANGPNDVLPYSPSSNQDIPLSLALAQLLAERNNVGGGIGGPLLPPFNGDGEDGDGQWMNTWTQPEVDYLGFPMDVGAAAALPRLDGDYGFGGGKPSKIGFTPQKRFMVSKRKRSVGSQQDNDSHEDDDSSCKSDKKTCLLRKYGQLAAAKVAPA